MTYDEILEAMREAEKFIFRHSEPWYVTGQEARRKIRSAIAALEGMQNAEGQITVLVCGSLDEVVNRFLGWRLPEDFCPDAGISFNPEFNFEYMAKQGKPPMRHEPTGTNLFNADQARQMIEYILGTPAAPKPTGEE